MQANLENQIKIARSELKNIRQEMIKLTKNYEKDVAMIKTFLFSYHEVSLPKNLDKRLFSKKITSQEEIPKKNLFSMKPIGYIESCFKTKNGTPRQASLCPDTKAYLKIEKSTFLEGLSEFSHIWILFLFHENNQLKYPKAKIHPPRLNGSSIGVFATRSPHRPNPIGLSLTKLIKVEGNELTLSKVDLIDGTPVLDIKPYIPDYDSPFVSDVENSNSPKSSSHLEENVKNDDIHASSEINFDSGPKIKTASWLAKTCNNLDVSFTPRSEADILKFHNRKAHKIECGYCLNFIENMEEAKLSIIKILQNDPRSAYRRKKCQDKLYYFFIDSMHITCWFDDELSLAEVLRIRPLNTISLPNVTSPLNVSEEN